MAQVNVPPFYFLGAQKRQFKLSTELNRGTVHEKITLMVFVILALAGCKDRVIWDDKGKVDEATQDREVWNSNGEMETDDREVWVNKEGEEVVK